MLWNYVIFNGATTLWQHCLMVCECCKQAKVQHSHNIVPYVEKLHHFQHNTPRIRNLLSQNLNNGQNCYFRKQWLSDFENEKLAFKESARLCLWDGESTFKQNCVELLRTFLVNFHWGVMLQPYSQNSAWTLSQHPSQMLGRGIAIIFTQYWYNIVTTLNNVVTMFWHCWGFYWNTGFVHCSQKVVWISTQSCWDL